MVMRRMFRCPGRTGLIGLLTAAAATVAAEAPARPQIPGLSGGEPLFQVMPHLGNRENVVARVVRCMDDLGVKTTRNLEHQIRWSDCEPLPGLYDFSELDAILDAARERNFKVLIWGAFEPPEWSPAHFTKNSEGTVFGHTTYLFHGARLNRFQSPVLRKGMIDFVRALVRHTRNHPATQGYYYLVEHPGEAPYADWFEGFDDITIGNFRAAMRTRYGTIVKANAAWRTAFPGFDTIRPPRVAETCTPRFRLDWMRFRVEAVHSLLLEAATLTRELAPDKLLMVYADGMIFDKMTDFAKLGVLSANGGCDRPEISALSLVRAANSGVPQRAEESSVTQWAAEYPTRLDTSVFSMLQGGGANTHCKMFLPVGAYQQRGSLDAIRRSPWALDRFEKFRPIWRELAETDRICRDVRAFENINGMLIHRKSTYDGGGDSWFTMNFLDAQIPLDIAPGPGWLQSKLVIMPRNLAVLENATLDGLADYVRNGGALLMRPESGRHTVERPDEDWTLLRRFGFAPPQGAPRPGHQAISGTGPFARYGALGELRGVFTPQPGDGETVLAVNGAGTPVLTRRTFGRGRVYTVWCDTVLPPGNNGARLRENSLFRAVAEDAGARLPARAANRRLWVNVLKHRSRDVYYVLAMCNQRGGVRDETIELPECGNAKRRTELISGKTGTFQGKLTVTLAPREVAIYRLEP